MLHSSSLQYVFFQDGEIITGHIVEILANVIDNRAVIVLDVFQVLSA